MCHKGVVHCNLKCGGDPKRIFITKHLVKTELTDDTGVFTYPRTSYRNGRNTDALVFENLKPVEIIKKSFQHHLTDL